MKKIRAGIIGMGYIGVSHIEALRRLGSVEVCAVADTNAALVRKKSEEYYIPKCYTSVDDLIADEGIDVVHNCTPNYLHLEINEKIIKSGKHVFSEKPLARSSAESARMLELLRKNPGIVAGVNFNYRMYPLVQEMKSRIRNGDIGKITLVHGSYLQDWLLFETDYNWRIEPEICGPSRCVADLGSHWMDAVQTVTGSRITDVLADLAVVIPVRKKPKTQVETFSLNVNGEYEDRIIKTEDYGAVLFKMDNGAHGVFHVSEVSAGRGCYFNFEVDGSEASLQWNQETADQMWMGFRDRDNLQVMRNPNILAADARKYSYLAKGHPEGWNDAFKSSLQSFYQFIADGKEPGKDACDFATFGDGHYLVKLTEAILKSNEAGHWTKVD